jgi:hypothetical protein
MVAEEAPRSILPGWENWLAAAGCYWDASIKDVIAVSTGNFDNGFATINYVGPPPGPPSTPEPGSFFLFGFGVVAMAKFWRSLYL